MPLSFGTILRSSTGCDLAPVALFVYNRLAHTERAVNSLRANYLVVFSDAAKNDVAVAAVQGVREYIRSINGFASITIIERERNLGLANSIIAGVTQVINIRRRVIVVEDDLVTSPDFLNFMNQALHRYELEPKVFSISGFNFGLRLPKRYAFDAFCFYRSSSWGWATWEDRWAQTDWEISDYKNLGNDRSLSNRFNRGGEDLAYMLDMQMAGKIDSWAIRWAYTHCKREALALLSLRPRVCHTGYGASATHSRLRPLKAAPVVIEARSQFKFPDIVHVEEAFAAELQRSFRPSLFRKAVRYLLQGRVNADTTGATKDASAVS